MEYQKSWDIGNSAFKIKIIAVNAYVKNKEDLNQYPKLLP